MKGLGIIFILLASCMTFDYDINKCDCTPIRIEFEEFIYQSKTRGIKIKNSSLKIELVKSIEGGPAARTYHSKNLIRIDTTKYNWNSFLRQKLIYHELAHFYLKRSHENNTFYYDGKNVPISLMSERTKIDFNGSSDELKEHYWNELFYNK